MKTVLVLSALLCAAFAAPAENDEMAAEPTVEPPQEETTTEPAPVSEDSQQEVAEPKARYVYCGIGWLRYQSNCYQFVNIPMNWYNAEKYCENLDGHLTSATNPGEYSFLQQLTYTAGQSVAWMGGFRLQSTWLWIDHEDFYYNNWFYESSYSGSVCMYLNFNDGWTNTQCTYSYPFICSKK